MSRVDLRRPLLALGTVLVIALLVLTVGTAFAAKLTRYVLPGNSVFPEGIAYQQDTPYFYVSSNAGGTIFRGTLDQEMGSPAKLMIEPGQ